MDGAPDAFGGRGHLDRKSTRLNYSHALHDALPICVDLLRQ